MNTSVNVILLLILTLLTGLVFYSQQYSGIPDFVPVSQINPDSINHIQISIRGETSATLRKNHNRWQILIDENYVDANEQKIAQLLSLFSAPSLQEFDIGNNDLEKYGLSNPNIKVQFKQFSIAFGKTEPISRNRYLFIDNKIHLIQDNFYYLLISPAESFVK